MPGMPVFQELPSQLKGQIYVLNSTTQNVVPLSVDSTGNLPVSGTVDLNAGATIDNVTTVSTITNDVKITNGATPLSVGLDSGATLDSLTTLGTVTNDVKIVNGATPLSVGLDSGATLDSLTTLGTVTNDVKIVNGTTPLSVGLDSGTNVIGRVENELVFTNLDAFGAPTPLTSMPVGTAATVTSETQDISKESSYNWFIKNTGTTSSDQDITLKVELSPDETNWIEDTGAAIEVPFNTSKMIIINNFLQYARFTITGGAEDTTVISCFQAQH